MMDILTQHYSTFVESLNLPYLYSYIFLSPTIIDTYLFPGFLSSILSFASHLSDLAYDIISIMYYLLIYFLKLLFISMPYLLKFLSIVVEFHKTQLKPIEIFIEILIISLTLFYFIFRKRIQQLWTNFLQKLSKKYQQLAKIAPHILFFVTAGLFAIFGSKFLIPLSSPKILPLFTLIRPLIRSFRVWKIKDPEVSLKLQQDMIVLWTILGSYFALTSFGSMIPFSKFLLSFIPSLREFSLVIAIWIQFSPVCANLVFESTVPIIHYYTNQIPVADLSTTSGISHSLHALRFVGLPESLLSSLKGLLNDSSALIIVLIFFFLPFNLSNIGVIIISLLLPAYKTSTVIVESRLQTKNNSTSTRLKTPSSSSSSSSHSPPIPPPSIISKSFNLISSYLPFSKTSLQQQQQQQEDDLKQSKTNPIQFWLEYWMCLGILLTLQTYGIIKLWPNSSMVMCLWLQNSHFCGATKIFQWVHKLFNDISSYEKTRTKPTTTPLIKNSSEVEPATPSNSLLLDGNSSQMDNSQVVVLGSNVELSPSLPSPSPTSSIPLVLSTIQQEVNEERQIKEQEKEIEEIEEIEHIEEKKEEIEENDSISNTENQNNDSDNSNNNEDPSSIPSQESKS